MSEDIYKQNIINKSVLWIDYTIFFIRFYLI